MNIAYVHYQAPGDTALNHVTQFVAAARGLGHRVDVYAMNPAGESNGTAAAEHSAFRKYLSRYLHEPKELAWNVAYAVKEARALRGARPDVLLVRDHYLTASSRAVSRVLGLPWVLEVNSPPEEAGLYLDQYAHLPVIPKLVERWKLRSAARVVCVSEVLKRHLVRAHGVAEERVVVAHNGADTSRFYPGIAGDEESSRRLRPGVVVGFVGSFQQWHGTELLARMIDNVGRRLPAARFLLVGDGPDLARVRSVLAGPLAARAVLTGRVEHHRVPALMACFDVAVIADAGFYMSPLKLLEYMAAGKAVVAPAYDALAEVVSDGNDGLLFRPGNAEDLTAAVVRLVERPDERRRLGSAAAEKIRSRLTWAHNAAIVAKACADAVEERRMRAA
jgi:glycosyltransferase involved in cell wall biosynthesis